MGRDKRSQVWIVLGVLGAVLGHPARLIGRFTADLTWYLTYALEDSVEQTMLLLNVARRGRTRGDAMDYGKGSAYLDSVVPERVLLRESMCNGPEKSAS